MYLLLDLTLIFLYNDANYSIIEKTQPHKNDLEISSASRDLVVL